MKTKKLTKTAENFIRYSFNGNGIYHTTSYGSKRYNLSTILHLQS